MNIVHSHIFDAAGLESQESFRTLGAYYTPKLTARALAQWAIRSGHEKFLEPSAGGGALVSAAYEKAHQISAVPKLHGVAFDIDKNAIIKLKSLELASLDVNHLDFLQYSSNSANFDLVLANPPFNRNHSLSEERRQALRAQSEAPGAIGLWGHFLVHAIRFLRTGGRMASIVPRSVLFTVHGAKFLRDLCQQFSSVGIYELTNRPKWSNFADEAGAVILADGFKTGVCADYVRGYLNDDGSVAFKVQADCEYIDRISSYCTTLGEVATISIGAVTGRNSVFLLNEEERVRARISKDDVRPVVSRSKQLNGITLSRYELEQLAESGHKTWILAPETLSKNIEAYLKVIPEGDIETVRWFRKRTPWWKVQIPVGVDAVFTYMNDLGPRIVKIEPGIASTNTLHNIKFKKDIGAVQRRAAYLTPISTFGQLAAEKLGRTYGGGVLKFELADAKKLPILTGCKFSSELFKTVDQYAKSGDMLKGTKLVDRAMLQPIFGASWETVRDKLQSDLQQLRAVRREAKNKGLL